MTLLAQIQRIAEIEFSPILAETHRSESKLRLYLRDGSFVDIWVSEKLPHRFGFHWERTHLDQTVYRYDNFPDAFWRGIETFPYHFHNGSQANVELSSFPTEVLPGFRAFMNFVAARVPSTDPL